MKKSIFEGLRRWFLVVKISKELGKLSTEKIGI